MAGAWRAHGGRMAGAWLAHGWACHPLGRLTTVHPCHGLSSFLRDHVVSIFCSFGVWRVLRGAQCLDIARWRHCSSSPPSTSTPRGRQAFASVPKPKLKRGRRSTEEGDATLCKGSTPRTHECGVWPWRAELANATLKHMERDKVQRLQAIHFSFGKSDS